MQQFKSRPGETVNVALSRGPVSTVTVDAHGRITLPQIAIPDRDGVRITLSRQ